jgi:hypothetical protein
MMNFLRRLTRALPLPDDDILTSDRACMEAAAAAARARLAARGLLEVEAAAQRAVAERVREARERARIAA